MSLDWASAPVATAHAAIRNTGNVNDALANATVPNDLPCASSPHAQVGQWARYVGMVQDIWDAELFVASAPSSVSGLLVEDCAVPSSDNVKLSERLPIYLVSVPGASSWTRPAPPQDNAPTAQLTQRSKRSRDDVDDYVAPPPMQPTHSRPPRPKSMPVPLMPSDASGKRQRPGPALQEPDRPFLGFGLNLPQAGGAGSAVLAKVYDNCSSLQLKVNSIIEVVGVLQRGVPMSRADRENSDGFDSAFVEESIARNPSNVPRLHAVRVRVLEPWEINPVMRDAVASRGLSSVRGELQSVLPAMRELLVKYLASALYDDQLAAEYVLMALVSRPASRTGAGGALGKLSVNVVFPKEGKRDGDSVRFKRALQALLPSVVTVSVNIAALNARDLYPRKDYTANRLRAAPLQLPVGGCLLADETNLSNGQLAERGVKNLRALEAVSSRCVVPADFHYYNADLPTDNCSIFLSRGGKSIVKTDVQVRVQPDSNVGLVGWEACDEDMFRKLRLALAALVEDGDFNITEDVSGAVENQFVEARKAGKAQDGQEVLTRWLSVARSTARTFGEKELTTERWNYAMMLESEREKRMSSKTCKS